MVHFCLYAESSGTLALQAFAKVASGHNPILGETTEAVSIEGISIQHVYSVFRPQSNVT